MFSKLFLASDMKVADKLYWVVNRYKKLFPIYFIVISLNWSMIFLLIEGLPASVLFNLVMWLQSTIFLSIAIYRIEEI